MHLRTHRTIATIGIGLLAVAGACSGEEDPSTTDQTALRSTTAPSPPTTSSGQSTTTEGATSDVDQTPPASANGILVIDEVVWISSLNGDEIVAIDRATGEILDRVGEEAGVVGPDDLALGPDGRIWWTGFTTGAVGAFDPATGEGEVVAQLPPGANPIAVAPDGRIFVGLAITGEGLYEIDATGESDPELVIAKPGNVNGFDVADDLRIWGPRFGTAGGGEIVAINPDAGEIEVLADGFTANIALAMGPDERAYVASVGPARVEVWDPETGDPPELFATMATTAVDNLAFADDGTLYVSGFDSPTLNVVAVDGSVTTLSIGQ